MTFVVMLNSSDHHAAFVQPANKYSVVARNCPYDPARIGSEQTSFPVRVASARRAENLFRYQESAAEACFAVTEI
jgi:hypothetical protein